LPLTIRTLVVNHRRYALASVPTLDAEQATTVRAVSPSPTGPEVALLDFDGTLHRGWTLGALLDGLALHGELAAYAAKEFHRYAERYAGNRLAHDDLVELAEDLLRRAIGDVRPAVVAQVAELVANTSLAELFPFVRPLLAGLNDRGIQAVLVTGAPHLVMSRVAPALGITRFWAYDIEGGGASSCNPGRSTGKAMIAATEGRHSRVRLALGDSGSDRPLWEAAEIAVGVGGHLPPDIELVAIDPQFADTAPIFALLD
jgi:phosphoserine phosphatase